MRDTIYRQAAIDALRMDIDIIPYAKAREYARAVIETVYNRLEELPSAQRWIPVAERLPEKGGRYLCCWQGKTVDTGMFLNGHFRLYGEIKDHLITAWMPLPEPYKGESRHER